LLNLKSIFKHRFSQIIEIPLIFGLLIFFSCENDINKINKISSKNDLPDIAVENIESIFSEEGKIKRRLTAPLLYQYTTADQPYTEFPEGVKLNLYNANQQPRITAIADYAIWWRKNRLFEARGNVVLTNDKGQRLMTELLFGNEKEKKIYSNKLVTIIDEEGNPLKGQGGFESNFNFTVYTFHDVSGIINFHDEFITSDQR
jgi:LPS export ABC transporter protein LptC